MLKFLVIFISVIYLGGIIARWFMRKWLKNLSQQGNQQQEFKRKKEGEVTINQTSEEPKRRNGGEGEYVDFEEVK